MKLNCDGSCCGNPRIGGIIRDDSENLKGVFQATFALVLIRG